MNILFIGIRKKEEDIISGPLKISNYLYNHLIKDHDNIYYYGLYEDETPDVTNDILAISDREVKGPIKKIGKYIKENKINVVYFARYYSFLALYLVLLKRSLGFKLVYTVHGIVKKEAEINKSFKFYHAFFERLLLKNCDKIVVISHALKDELLHYYPNLKKDRIEIINNGVSLVPIKEHFDIRNLYELDSNKKIVFTVGIRKIKNIEVLLEEFVSKSELYSSSYLLVAGETDTEYAIGVIEKYNKCENVKFIGLVDTNLINNIYSQCDLFVQISEFETFGMAIVEALLHKKNVLISSELPIAQYFGNDEIYFYDKSKDNLGDILYSGATNNQINEKGYIKANKLFQWTKISQEYYEVFLSVYNK